MALDVGSVARELIRAYADKETTAVPPSERDGSFDLSAGYAVEAELARLRRASGRVTVGRKVGFANKAIWRVLKLDTLVWAHMYDDTVHDAPSGSATRSIGRMSTPKIEPEIVFKLKEAPAAEDADAAAILARVEWLALGFEIIDCVFKDWTFQPADFVAAFGLHAALVVGPPRRLEPPDVAAVVEQLGRFEVKLFRDDEVVAEGSGKNSLRSPALCLTELSQAIRRRSGAEPLAAGELVSSGTLTESMLIAPGQTWRAQVGGIELAGITLRIAE